MFALGSLLCSLALDGPQLILFRGLQGVGAAALMATAPALITDAFPPQERGKALGINAMSVYIGLSLGPPLGAFLTGELGWRSIFWVNIPIAAAVIALAYWKIARPSRVEDEGRFDLAGASSFAIALTAFLLALTFGGVPGMAIGLHARPFPPVGGPVRRVHRDGAPPRQMRDVPT